MLTLNLEAENYEELTKKVIEALSLTLSFTPAAAVATAAVREETDKLAEKEALDAKIAADAKATLAAEAKASLEAKATEAKAADAAKRGAKAKSPAKEEAPLISTGEPREEPGAEVAAAQGNGNGALSHQDIRDLMGTYANTFGMKAVQQDGPVILSRIFGEGKVRASDIPDNPDALKKAYDALNRAIETNEFKRALAS